MSVFVWNISLFLLVHHIDPPLPQTGLASHPVFWEWFQGFLQHFVAVYERSAPAHTRAAARWSERAERVEEYRLAGCRMVDLLG